MITLRKKPYVDTLSLTDMMTYDTKANIIEHCKIANIDIPQRWRKAEIGEALRDIFFHDSHWTIRLLPDEEITMLKQLLSLNVEEYITYPRNDAKYLLMQKLHLVVTYEAPTEWHIYMPNSIREILKDSFQLPDTPEVESKLNKTSKLGKKELSDMNLVDIIEVYPKMSQVGIYVTLELVNINLGYIMPYEDFPPYMDDLQSLEDAMMMKANQKVLESYATLLTMDMHTLYASVERMTKELEARKKASSGMSTEHIIHCGTMIKAMESILRRFHKIPAEDIEQMILERKMKNGLLHIPSLENMAREIAEELLIDLMQFTLKG